MKPNFDLNSPMFKLAFSLIQKEGKKALNTEQTVEKAIIPIYDLPKTKAHQIKKTKLEQIASGVLLKVKNDFFILTADHVFKNIGDSAIAISGSNQEKIQQFPGERFTSNNPTSDRKDINDASVYHMQAELPDSLKKIAISLDQIDFSVDDQDKPIFLISGFRARDSNTEGNTVYTKRKSFPTMEVENNDYDKFQFPKESHLIVAYDDQILIDGHWKVSPKPKGMSGGGIIKINGTKISTLKNENNIFEQKLSAITIEHHRGKHNNPGIVVGTRLNVHIGLIYQFMPGFLDNF